MRILDTNNDKALKNINLYLTRIEAQELLDDLTDMLQTQEKAYHVHINDLFYEHELTMAIYDMEDISLFNERSKKIIELDV